MSQLDVHLSLFMVHNFFVFFVFFTGNFSVFCIIWMDMEFSTILGFFLEHSAFVGPHSEFAEIGHFLFH